MHLVIGSETSTAKKALKTLNESVHRQSTACKLIRKCARTKQQYYQIQQMQRSIEPKPNAISIAY